MKTLKDHIIVYDDECPLCNAYTKGFVACGMLDKDGRTPYANIDTVGAAVDKKRASNEIALVDTTTGEVTYGIRSLTKIIGHSIPVLNRLLNNALFQHMLRPVYAFISYNRKVIVPGEVKEGATQCIPDFNVHYRIAYVVLTWLVVSFILNALPQEVRPLIPAGNVTTELLICGGQLVFQSVVLASYYRDFKTTLHYLGNMMTVSLIGTVLLLPAWMLFSAGVGSTLFFSAWFTAVVGVMFLEHARRVKILGLHKSLSLTWMGYRMIVLGLNIRFLFAALTNLL